MGTFQEPIDVPDAEWRVNVLTEEIARIESQLGDPRRKTDRASGRLLADDDYQGWRSKAEDAMYHKRRELGYLRAWLQRKEPQREAVAEDLVLAVQDTIPILRGLGSIVESPAIKRLFDVFGMITGAFKRE